MRELVLRNKKLLHDHANEFRQIFGIGLRGYMDDLTGFDITGFDDREILSGDGCMADAVMEKYGARAVELIRVLIGAIKGDA